VGAVDTAPTVALDVRNEVIRGRLQPDWRVTAGDGDAARVDGRTTDGQGWIGGRLDVHLLRRGRGRTVVVGHRDPYRHRVPLTLGEAVGGRRPEMRPQPFGVRPLVGDDGSVGVAGDRVELRSPVGGDAVRAIDVDGRVFIADRAGTARAAAIVRCHDRHGRVRACTPPVLVDDSDGHGPITGRAEAAAQFRLPVSTGEISPFDDSAVDLPDDPVEFGRPCVGRSAELHLVARGRLAGTGQRDGGAAGGLDGDVHRVGAGGAVVVGDGERYLVDARPGGNEARLGAGGAGGHDSRAVRGRDRPLVGGDVAVGVPGTATVQEDSITLGDGLVQARLGQRGFVRHSRCDTWRDRGRHEHEDDD